MESEDTAASKAAEETRAGSSPASTTCDGICVSFEAIPYLQAFLSAMEAGDIKNYNPAAVQWAEFLINCINAGLADDELLS